MKIDFIGQQLSTGGSELQFLLLAKSLQEAGHEVRMLILQDPAPDISEVLQEFQNSLGNIFFLGKRHDGISDAVNGVRMQTWVRSANPDVVYAISSRASISAGLTRIIPGSPAVVMSRRSLVSARNDSKIAAWARIRAVRRADRIIANSAQVALDSSTCEGINLDHYDIIPNIVPEYKFARNIRAKVETQYPIVVSVANLRQPKNHLVLLDSLNILKDQGIPTTLVCVGEGNLRDLIQQRAVAYELDVRLVGSVPDPRPYLACANVFVQSSSAEGMSNSLLEAMAAGLAIVATDVGGTSEALGDTGVLTTADDPNALAEGLRKLLSNSHLAHTLGNKARLRARQFNATTSVAKHEVSYARAIERRRRRT